MKRILRSFGMFFAVLTMMSVLAISAAAEETTVLFTHDMHSHFLPVQSTDGGESGGYARLKTAIDQEKAKHPNALVLDGGDFSIGTLFQTLYTTQAAELRTMGKIGFDATIIGNHEFDHKSTGFAQMLNSAVESGDPVPAMLCANYKPAEDNPDREYIMEAMEAYGVQETMIIERGGVTYGIFGLIGVDSDDCAPTSGFVLEDPATAAKRCVETLQSQGAEVIICLSHSGTWSDPEKSEDEILAKNVPGIDVIISGHTHTKLDEPIVVNNTYIVSSSQYTEHLGVITLQHNSDGTTSLAEYRLIPIDETIPADAEIESMVEMWKDMVGEEYLANYGLTYDQVLTTIDFDATTPRSGVQENNAVGALVADAFHWAMENLAQDDGYRGNTVTVTADGVLRAAVRSGEITASEAFDVLSMGVGEDGTSGFPLVAVYLSGKELKAAMEVDASVTPIMPAAQLYMSGVSYQFNTNRMFFNRVVKGELAEPWYSTGFEGGATAKIDDNALYRVVTGMYSAQMLGSVKEKSMGLLSLIPKDAAGVPITDFTKHIVYDQSGNELKEWYALAAYLDSFGTEGVDEWYRTLTKTNGTKVVSDRFSPAELLANWNWISWLLLAIIVLLILLVALVVCVVRRWRRKKKKSA